MGLSKKNLGKLNTFIKNNNLINSHNLSKDSHKCDKSRKAEEPSRIFYSIVDNSDNINETSEANQLLKKSEEIFHNINCKKTNYSKNLSFEDQLYDEFNYLLDE